MAKKGLTEIVAIIDKSGSMKKLCSKTIEGVNEFITNQKGIEGQAIFSLIFFGSPGKDVILYDSMDINEIPELNEHNYQPNGTTALYDCVGKSISALKKRIKNTPEEEKPERVLFVILTDGEENSSRFYDKNEIFKMIKKREKKGWRFIYLGSNQDSFVEGGKIGISSGNSLDFASTTSGMGDAYTATCDYATAFRTSSLSKSKKLTFDDVSKTPSPKSKKLMFDDDGVSKTV